MPDALPPFAIYLLGALIVPFLRGKVRQGFALLVPVLGFANFFLIKEGIHYTVPLLEFDLVLMRGDAWSFIFLNIFTVLSFVGILYIIKENLALDLSAGLLYAGAAMGVVMAGDFLTVFFFWEMLTIGAVMCILARRTVASGSAANRYILVHIFGGVVLLAGLVIHISSGGSVEFTKMKLEGVGPWLMFLGFGINCAWPLVGAWLTDTYPEASIGGVIFMATYTTKTAVYVLARAFPEEPILLWIGMAMATIPIFYAVIENDLRRVLAYSLINQVGFMIVGVGLGTEMSLNGTAAHAYCHILYKALLFMSIGSVIYRTGKSKATELGGLYRTMPLTCIFCCIGAASISAFPLFSGFISKSMIMSSAAKEGYVVIWLALLFASAGVFHHAGIKIPFFAFFSHDSGMRPKEAPLNQLIAMGIVATLCIGIAIFPEKHIYKALPNQPATEAAAIAMEAESNVKSAEVVASAAGAVASDAKAEKKKKPPIYKPYTIGHVTDQLALLLFSALAFTLLMRAGLYPAEIRSTNVDFDWIWRRGGRGIYWVADKTLNNFNKFAHLVIVCALIPLLNRFVSRMPARITDRLATSAGIISGKRGTELRRRRAEIAGSSKLGALPIGVTACLAVLILGILFFLSRAFSG